jgi:hypothetical protein
MLRQGIYGPGHSYQEAHAHKRVQEATATLLADSSPPSPRGRVSPNHGISVHILMSSVAIEPWRRLLTCWSGCSKDLGWGRIIAASAQKKQGDHSTIIDQSIT